jgi:gluconolactonase
VKLSTHTLPVLLYDKPIRLFISGKIIQEVKLPVKKITSLCFGGSNYEDMFVTSDRTTLSEEEFQKEPLAGSVFRVMGLGIRGLPQFVYKG